MTELRPFTVRDGIEAVRALRVLCAEVAILLAFLVLGLAYGFLVGVFVAMAVYT